MSIQMKALQTFSGPDGKHAQGDVFEAKADRVKFLEDGGYAARATKEDKQDAAQAADEQASPAAAPRAGKTATKPD